jgi:hypothetical protein
MEVYASC